MLSTRKMLAAGSAGALLALAAVVPANASPAPDPRCALENSGALGVTCVDKLNVVITATTPAVPPTPADCQVAIGVLNDDRAIGIADEKAVKDARAADVAALALRSAARTTYDEAVIDDHNEDTTAAGTPPVLPVEPATGDKFDIALAKAKSDYAAAQSQYDLGKTAGTLHDALAKLQRDEIAYKRAVVVVNLKCGPTAPATSTPPAPVVIESPTIISGQAPPPVVVHDNLPVTG